MSVDAGGYAAWIEGMQRALRGEADADVPCGTCTACCTSSQFIHIAPDEIDALAHIPAELLFPAPGRPSGHQLLGYDERGHCPMFADGRCSIYAHRPRTCRTYDCRVIAAAGLNLDDDPTRSGIAERVRAWTFGMETGRDRARATAVRGAVEEIRVMLSTKPRHGPGPSTTEICGVTPEASTLRWKMPP